MIVQISTNSLPMDNLLYNKYKILQVLGEGGFGITYKAMDTSLDRLCVIKEFLPTSLAVRNNENTTVSIRSQGDKDNYEWGLKSFSKEAKALAKFSHPNIVEVRTTFEDNNTAYFEMPYEEGMDLEKYLDEVNPNLSEQQIIDIAIPILNGLNEAHKHNILHRDIKPGNIFLRKDGMPMLIDFGAAREAMGSKSQDLTQLLTPPYAPPEQYQSDRNKQGAWTDIYALGITLYKLVAKLNSKQVPASTDRQSEVYIEHGTDPLIMPKSGEYSSKLINAITQMIKIRVKERPQTCAQIIDLIIGDISKPLDNVTVKPEKNENKIKFKIFNMDNYNSLLKIDKDIMWISLLIVLTWMVGSNLYYIQDIFNIGQIDDPWVLQKTINCFVSLVIVVIIRMKVEKINSLSHSLFAKIIILPFVLSIIGFWLSVNFEPDILFILFILTPYNIFFNKKYKVVEHTLLDSNIKIALYPIIMFIVIYLFDSLFTTSIIYGIFG